MHCTLHMPLVQIQRILVSVAAMINSYYIKSKHHSKISECRDKVKIKTARP